MRKKIYRKIGSQSESRSSVFFYACASLPFASFFIIIGIASYVFLTSYMVWNASKKTDYEQKISIASESLIDLEAKLSSIDKKITPEFAFQRGFEETSSVRYIKNKPLTKVTSSNEVEL